MKRFFGSRFFSGLMVLALLAQVCILPAAADDADVCPQDPDGAHFIVTDEAKSPTCFGSGRTEGSHCANCGKVIVAQEVIPSYGGHLWGSNGVCIRARCGAMCAHEGRHYEEKSPTCTNTGHTAGWKCVDCGVILEGMETIPVDPEAHVMTTIQPSEPTCTADGHTGGTYCTECGAGDMGEIIPALGHDWTNGDGACARCGEGCHHLTEDGVSAWTEGTCTLCGKVCDHSQLRDESYDPEPDCLHGGVLWGECADCGQWIEKEVPATGHTSVSGRAVEATCTMSGHTAGRRCANCGITLQAQVNIPATGHSYDGGVVTKEATCTAAGERVYTCQTCGAVKTEAILAKAHTTEYRYIAEENVLVCRCAECGLEFGASDVPGEDGGLAMEGSAARAEGTYVRLDEREDGRKTFAVTQSAEGGQGLESMTLTAGEAGIGFASYTLLDEDGESVRRAVEIQSEDGLEAFAFTVEEEEDGAVILRFAEDGRPVGTGEPEATEEDGLVVFTVTTAAGNVIRATVYPGEGIRLGNTIWIWTEDGLASRDVEPDEEENDPEPTATPESGNTVVELVFGTKDISEPAPTIQPIEDETLTIVRFVDPTPVPYIQKFVDTTATPAPTPEPTEEPYEDIIDHLVRSNLRACVKCGDTYSTSYSGNLCPDCAKGSCVPSGTLITLADGSQKPVEELTTADECLVFDHENGTWTTAGIVFMENDGTAVYTVIHLAFSDGSETRVIGEHGLFDLTEMEYVYFTEESFETYIGHRFYKAELTDGVYTAGEATLVAAWLEEEETGCYDFPSRYYLNYFCDGFLSMPGGSTGMFNFFDYDEDLGYDRDAMAADLAEYGLFDYEALAGIITREEFSQYPAQYLNVALGKGLMTEEQLETLIGRYILEKR